MPLKRTEKFGYATGDFACCLVWQTLSLYLLYYPEIIADLRERREQQQKGKTP